MNTLILLVIYGIEALKYRLGNQIVFQEKIERRSIYLIGLLLSIGYLGLCNPTYERGHLFIYIVLVINTFFTMNGILKERMIKLLLLLILLVSIDSTATVVINIVQKGMAKMSYSPYIQLLMESTWGLFVVFLIYLWIKRRQKEKAELLTNNMVMLIIVVSGLAILCTVSALNFATRYAINSGFQAFADVLISISYICICLLCWLLIYFRKRMDEKNQLLAMERSMKESQNSYYRLLLEKEEETRKFRHDFNNHSYCIRELIQQGDMERVKSYIDTINEQMERIQQISVQTGYDFFDIILNEKLSKLNSKVDVTMKGKICSKICVDEADFCTIFANLFQNVVEELSRQEQKNPFLEIEIKSGKEYLEIQIRNSTCENIKLMKNGFPPTRKKDKKNHGIGLANVQNIVERNHGEFKIETKEKVFEVKVILPINK